MWGLKAGGLHEGKGSRETTRVGLAVLDIMLGMPHLFL